MNVAAKDFYSKRFLNVLTKGRIQRPLSSPPSPPSGSPVAHSTLLSPAFRRFRPPTFNLFGGNRTAGPRRWLSAQKPQPVSRKEEGDLSAPTLQPVNREEEGGDMIPLQNIEMGTSGGASLEAEPLNNASSILFSIREEDETEVDLYS